jgi:hypothetical protein
MKKELQRVGSITGMVGERGETHLALTIGNQRTSEIIPAGYGYKGFVTLDRTYNSSLLRGLVFRKRGPEPAEVQLLKWADVRGTQVADLDLDVFVASGRAVDGNPLERLIGRRGAHRRTRSSLHG